MTTLYLAQKDGRIYPLSEARLPIALLEILRNPAKVNANLDLLHQGRSVRLSGWRFKRIESVESDTNLTVA